MQLRPVVLLAASVGVAALVPMAAAGPDTRDRGVGRYVVTVSQDVSPVAAAARARRLGGSVDHVYTSALRGYALSLPRALVTTLLKDPHVVAVEAERTFRTTASQPRPPYGLDRIDQRGLPLSGRYDYAATGAGVTAYVVDTGIRLSHRDFGGRALNGVDAVDGDVADDCNGHGTHVAGTLGGASFGVAKQVRLMAVRVLDCEGSGSTSDIVAGLDWVARHHRAGQPAVANLSLSGGASSTIDKAVQGVIRDGVSVAVAAGNGDALGFAADACRTSPGRVPEALTVGASDEQDNAAAFSNYGSCVDLYAPGVDVLSATTGGDDARETLSGTSMASPHVAGVAALHLQRHRAASPAAVAAALVKASTKDAVVVEGGGGLLGGSGSGSSRKGHLLFAGA